MERANLIKSKKTTDTSLWRWKLL